jgi:hypothetical protein
MLHIEGMFHSNRCVAGGWRKCLILVQITETETKIVISFVLVWNFRRRLHPKMESRYSSPGTMHQKGQSCSC